MFPNAIQITTTAEKYGFSSLMSRDITYNVLFKIWQNSLLNEVALFPLLFHVYNVYLYINAVLRPLGVCMCASIVPVSRFPPLSFPPPPLSLPPPFFSLPRSILPQHLTPLELVKAARKASGDVAEVGTVENLWGEERLRSGSSFDNLNMVSGPSPSPCPRPTVSGAAGHKTSPLSLSPSLSLLTMNTCYYSYTCQPSATASLPAVLPTHVEIMPSAENHTHFTGVGSEVRGDLPERKSE